MIFSWIYLKYKETDDSAKEPGIKKKDIEKSYEVEKMYNEIKERIKQFLKKT